MYLFHLCRHVRADSTRISRIQRSGDLRLIPISHRIGLWSTLPCSPVGGKLSRPIFYTNLSLTDVVLWTETDLHHLIFYVLSFPRPFGRGTQY